MRRLTAQEILKENRLLLAASVLFILFGIYILLSPLLSPKISYDALEESDAVVMQLKYRYLGRGGGYYFLKTGSGESYRIAPRRLSSQAKALLTAGTAVHIKWRSGGLFSTRFAEEISAGGQLLMAYDDTPQDPALTVILGLGIAAFGAGGLLMLRHLIKTNRRAQEKRDDRIRRKNGAGRKTGKS